MKKLLRLFTPFMLILTFMLAFGVNVHATEKTLSPTNGWVKGTISTAGEVDYYTVTLKKAGFLTVAYQGWSIGYTTVYVMDEDLVTEIWNGSLYGCSDANPKTVTKTLALEAGTYKIKATGYWTTVYNGYTGDYRLKTSFTAANNQESEPNNSFAKATTLKANTWMTGFISQTDRCDFYKVTVPFKQTVTVTFTSKMGSAEVELWDSDYLSLKKTTVYSGSEEAPNTTTFQETLAKGTYYIKVSPYSDSYSGRYRVKFTCKTTATVKVTSLSITGNKVVAAGSSFTLKATAAPTTATNKAVTWSSSNTSVATVNSSGKVTTKLPGKTVITATAKDGSGVKKTCTVIVKPKKHSTLAVAKIATKKAIVVWNTQKNVTGYQIQYSKNSNFSNVIKTIKKGQSYDNVTLTGLAKAKYYVRIRSYKTIGGKTYYGAWSATKTVNMK